MNWGNSWGNNFFPSTQVNLTIPIDGGWNTKTVKAVQIVDLAVVSFAEDFDWTVVHVPTLTRFDKAIPDGEHFEEALCKWCWKVQQIKPELWADIAKYNNSTYKNINKRVLDLIQTFCLAIKLED